MALSVKRKFSFTNVYSNFRPSSFFFSIFTRHHHRKPSRARLLIYYSISPFFPVIPILYTSIRTPYTSPCDPHALSIRFPLHHAVALFFFFAMGKIPPDRLIRCASQKNATFAVPGYGLTRGVGPSLTSSMSLIW